MTSMSTSAVTLLVLALGATVALAGDKPDDHGKTHKGGEKRELGAHEHGHGTLNIVISGKTVGLELEVPGADIVGFEHEAKTDDKKAALQEAKTRLQNILAYVTPPASAGCSIASAKVEVEHIGENDHDDDHKGHDIKTHKAGDDHDDHKGHADFHATYELTCTTPAALTSLEFPYFAAFKGAEELDVTIVTDKGQSKHEVSRKTMTISLGGAS